MWWKLSEILTHTIPLFINNAIRMGDASMHRQLFVWKVGGFHIHRVRCIASDKWTCLCDKCGRRAGICFSGPRERSHMHTHKKPCALPFLAENALSICNSTTSGAFVVNNIIAYSVCPEKTHPVGISACCCAWGCRMTHWRFLRPS